MRTIWQITVFIHILVVLANVVAAIVTPFLAPWYIAVPLLTLWANWAWMPLPYCPLTHFENWMRRRMGMPEIDDFVNYYVCERLFGISFKE